MALLYINVLGMSRVIGFISLLEVIKGRVGFKERSSFIVRGRVKPNLRTRPRVFTPKGGEKMAKVFERMIQLNWTMGDLVKFFEMADAMGFEPIAFFWEHYSK